MTQHFPALHQCDVDLDQKLFLAPPAMSVMI